VRIACGEIDAALALDARVFEASYAESKLRKRLGLPQRLVGDWERGFPAAAKAPFEKLRDVWSRLAFRVPIRKLHVYEVSESDATEFVTWPALSLLQELEFDALWHIQIHPNVIPILASCDALSGLKVLKLRYAHINVTSVMALLDSPHLATLDVLRLGIDRATLALSNAVKRRLAARFGREVFDGRIPF
jgi:hypothetical protein